MSNPGAGLPIPMVLHCPSCGFQHVDKPEPERGWDNPPHKSHLCARCGSIWRPADIETIGVEKIATRGKADCIKSGAGLPEDVAELVRDLREPGPLRHKDAADTIERLAKSLAELRADLAWHRQWIDGETLSGDPEFIKGPPSARQRSAKENASE